MLRELRLYGRPRAWLLAGLLLGWSAADGESLRAQDADAPFVPEVGRPGKDVVWVPSPDPLVDTMLEIAEVTDRDVVMDLGSGDGRTVIAAARLGARAIGVEYDPELVELSQARAEAAGVMPVRPRFHRALGDPALLSVLKNVAREIGYALR